MGDIFDTQQIRIQAQISVNGVIRDERTDEIQTLPTLAIGDRFATALSDRLGIYFEINLANYHLLRDQAGVLEAVRPMLTNAADLLARQFWKFFGARLAKFDPRFRIVDPAVLDTVIATARSGKPLEELVTCRDCKARADEVARLRSEWAAEVVALRAKLESSKRYLDSMSVGTRVDFKKRDL